MTYDTISNIYSFIFGLVIRALVVAIFFNLTPMHIWGITI